MVSGPYRLTRESLGGGVRGRWGSQWDQFFIVDKPYKNMLKP